MFFQHTFHVSCTVVVNAAGLSTSLSRAEVADCVEIENNSTPGSLSDMPADSTPPRKSNAPSESTLSTPLDRSTGQSGMSGASRNDSTPRSQLDMESTTQSQSTGVSG